MAFLLVAILSSTSMAQPLPQAAPPSCTVTILIPECAFECVENLPIVVAAQALSGGVMGSGCGVSTHCEVEDSQGTNVFTCAKVSDPADEETGIAVCYMTAAMAANTEQAPRGTVIYGICSGS